MRVTVPVEITTAKLTSTNVTDNTWYDQYGNIFTYPLWVNTTNYSLGNRVIYNNRAYESISNVPNHSNNIPPNTPTFWLDLGATNRFGMFDLTSNTQTVNASSINVTLTLGERVNTIGLLNVDAQTIAITMVNSGTTVYSVTENMAVRNATLVGWYAYFYTGFTTKKETAYFDLPPFSGATINIVITPRVGETAKCGGVVLGTNEFIGDVEDGATTDSLNFSVIDADTFGNTALIVRRSTEQIECELLSTQENSQRLKELRRMLNAKPAMWSGLDDPNDPYFGNLILLGIYERFTTRLQRPLVFTSLKVREI